MGSPAGMIRQIVGDAESKLRANIDKLNPSNARLITAEPETATMARRHRKAIDNALRRMISSPPFSLLTPEDE